MAPRLPPLNPLRAFEAAARHGSLSKAAGELNVTHGAVSHQIKALEAALDARLFERSGGRLKLTAHGAEFLPAVSSAFEGIAAATARMTRPTSAGTLSLACVPALLSFWLMPRLGGFLAQFPDIRLTVRPANDPDDIHSRDVDLCILYGDGSWTDCWLRHLTGLELFPVISPSLLNTRPIRAVRDLGEHVMVHADDGREWHTWLAAADALDLKRGPQHHFGDARLGIEAAVHGYGVALGDTVTASGFLMRGQLVAPFNLVVPAVDAFYVACRNDLRATPVVRVFVDWLAAQFAAGETRAEPGPSGRRATRRGAGRPPRAGPVA